MSPGMSESLVIFNVLLVYLVKVGVGVSRGRLAFRLASELG